MTGADGQWAGQYEVGTWFATREEDRKRTTLQYLAAGQTSPGRNLNHRGRSSGWKFGEQNSHPPLDQPVTVSLNRGLSNAPVARFPNNALRLSISCCAITCTVL
jgi:hypothetical protein